MIASYIEGKITELTKSLETALKSENKQRAEFLRGQLSVWIEIKTQTIKVAS